MEKKWSEEIKALRREIDIMDIQRKAVQLGFDYASAGRIAKGMVGAANPEGALQAISTSWMQRERNLKKSLMEGIPRKMAAPYPSVSKEELNRMSYKERAEFAEANPEQYERLMGRA